MVSDPVADMLTRIRNGQERKKESIEMPYSRLNESVAKVLRDSEFIKSVRTFKEKHKTYKSLVIELKYDDSNEPRIRSIERISRPGLRKYMKAREIRPVLGGLGIYVVSTSRGIMSSREAKRKNLGGEIICRVY